MEHNAYNDFDPNLSSDFPARKWKVARHPPKVEGSTENAKQNEK